jgi:hypothetical protein
VWSRFPHLVAALLVAFTRPASADAARVQPLRVVDVGSVGTFPQAAGPWITWRGRAGATELYKVRTAARTTIPAPPGCAHVDADSDRDILYSCGADGPPFWTPRPRLRDSVTGVVSSLPAPSPPLYGENGLHLDGLGRSWFGVVVRGPKADGLSWVSRADGRVTDVGDIGQHRVLDPDHPSLVRPLCRGMLVPQEGQPYGPGYGRLAIAGHRAAAAYRRDADFGLHRRDRVVLQQCGKTVRTLQAESRRFQTFSDPVIDTRIVAWLSYGPRSTRLQVFSLHSGKRRSTAVPSKAQLLLTDRRLHIAAEGRLMRVKL